MCSMSLLLVLVQMQVKIQIQIQFKNSINGFQKVGMNIPVGKKVKEEKMLDSCLHFVPSFLPCMYAIYHQ